MNKKMTSDISWGKPRIQSVPRDRFLAAFTTFREFSNADAEKCVWLFDELHKISETKYNGDGSWGRGLGDKNIFENVESSCHKPLLRESYVRLAAYLSMAEAPAGRTYIKRAGEAAGFLVKEQRHEGYFPYYLDDSGWPVFIDPFGVMYVTGFSSNALLQAYSYFDNPAYLDAVFKACLWGARFPCCYNYNYNSLVINMLARGSVVLSKPEHFSRADVPGYQFARPAGQRIKPGFAEHFLAIATEGTMQNILPGQQPNGGYLGHNSYIWYHGIITEANAAVVSSAGSTHADYESIKRSLIADINYIILNQSEDGSTYDNYESDTKSFFGLHEIEALLAAREIFGSKLDNILNGLAQALLRKAESKIEDPVFRNPEKKTFNNSVSGLMKGLGLLFKNFPLS